MTQPEAQAALAADAARRRADLDAEARRRLSERAKRQRKDPVTKKFLGPLVQQAANDGAPEPIATTRGVSGSALVGTALIALAIGFVAGVQFAAPIEHAAVHVTEGR